jgi:hypothetical protein
MAKRCISISYDFRPDEPSGGQEMQIRQAFADLGWTVTYYGSGSSNVHRCFLDVESDDCQLDHPTLIATLMRLGIPLTEDPSTYTTISGDMSMARRSEEWGYCQEADMADVHLQILDVTPGGSFQWKDRRVPCLGVRCIVSPHGSKTLRFPVCMRVTALRTEGNPLGHAEGPLWHPGERAFEAPTEEPVASFDLLVRILDIHRAGEVVFHSVTVASSRLS